MHVHARISKEWRQRMILMALMLNGTGLWFLYDGYLAWPSEERRFQQLVTLTAGTLAEGEKPTGENPEAVRIWKAHAAANSLPEKLPKHRSPSDLALQRVIGGIFMTTGLIFVGWVALQHRKSVRTDGDLITGAEGQTVHFDTIVEIDRRKWAKKGIAYALYDKDGKRRRLCLDDHKFIGCEAIILEAERRLAARGATSSPMPESG